MSELNEIMNGTHEIKNLHIEEDTLAFNTELDNYNWNLSPRDIEMIIWCLQQKIDKAIEYIKNEDIDICTIRYNDIVDTKNELLEILGDKEKDIEFDILKALNTDLPDDIEMG